MATMAGFEGYGGATITRRVDGSGAEWVGMCAKDGAGRFGFYVFKNGQNVPITPFCSGRGTIEDDGHWIAWEGNTYYAGTLPGWTPKATSGGYTVAPGASIRIFVDKDGYDGKQTVNLASYGIPPCSAVNIRLSLDAEAGRVFRCGPPTADPNLQTAAMLTVTGLGSARAYESGVVSVTTARQLLVMTENGTIAAGYVDVTGWFS